MVMKTRVRSIFPTLVPNTEVQHQCHRSHSIRQHLTIETRFIVESLECEKRTPHGESGGWFALVELLKIEERGQFPDESVKVEGV